MTRPKRLVVASAALVLLALVAGLAHRQWQLRPAGHVEVALESRAPHPLQAGTFVYELIIKGVTRHDGGTGIRESFRYKTRRGSEWSDVSPVTTQAGAFSVVGGEAHRLPETFAVELHQDRWGNEVERINSGSYFVTGWRAPSGLECMTWRTALGVGASPPDELVVEGTLVDADGTPLPFRASALVPPQVITASPTIRLAEPR